MAPGARDHDQHDAAKCAFCKNFHEFELPEHLLASLFDRRLVVFAGAGVSTEARTVLPTTFYEEIEAELGLASCGLQFPELMSRFAAQPDGRRRLLERIRTRLNYMRAFPELYRSATRFHREASTLFYVDTYVTTNWDDYFEVECGATPFVTAEDLALWNVSGRKVLKIHGSLGNPGSIVATSEDYKKAHRRLGNGALGSLLKGYLATKTILYVGYSFTDADFLAIHKYLARELGAGAPAAYIVTLEREQEARFRGLGLIPIFTDATYFLATLKAHLRRDHHFVPDERFSGVAEAHFRVVAEHEKLHEECPPQRMPETVYAACYQDGLTHAFERIGAMRGHGEYSHRCDVVQSIRQYDSLRSVATRRRRYTDVAYIDGYVNGLKFLLATDDERKALPFYYEYGARQDPRTLAEYKRSLRRQPRPHKAAAAAAARVAARYATGGNVLHHPPVLSGVDE